MYFHGMGIIPLLLLSLVLGWLFSSRIGGSLLGWAFAMAMLIWFLGKLVIIIAIFLVLFAIFKRRS